MPQSILRAVGTVLSRRRQGWALAAILAAGGLVTAWLVYDQAVRHERDRAAAAFAAEVSLVASGVERELVAVGEELNEVAAFVSLRGVMPPDEFRRYARSEVLNHSGLVAAMWAPRVPAADREEHEQRQRAAVTADYRIVTPGDGYLGDSASAVDYYPVACVEPLESNRAALGLDLASEPARAALLLEAARTGRMVVAPPLKLLQAHDAGTALLAVKAVYGRRQVPTGQPALASDDLGEDTRGFVLFAVRADALLTVLPFESRDHADEKPAFRLLDPSAGGATVVASPGWLPPPAGTPTWTREVAGAGAHWVLEARPSAAFVARRTSREPATLGVLTFLLFQSIAALLLSVSGHRHERARRRQDAITRAVVDHLVEGVVVADTEGRFVLFNARAERMLGLGLLQLNPAEWSAAYGCYKSEALEPYPPEDLPLALGLRGITSQDEDVFIRNPNVPGGRWISISGGPITGGDGEAMGAVVAFRDATERRRMESELRRSLHEMQQLKEAIDQAAIVSLTDAEGRITYCNDRFCDVSGYTRAELLGASHRLVKSDYHPDSFFAEMWRTISGGGVWRGEICNRSRAGEIYWVDTTIVPLFDGQDRPARYLAIDTDITERMRQQETVRRLSSVVEQTADAVFITDREGVIEYVNRGFEEATGYSADEVLGRTPSVLKSGRHDAKYYERLWATILAGKVWRSTTVNRRKDGREYHAEQSITPLTQADGRVTHFVSVVKDVTERIRRQEREIEMAHAARVQQRLYPDAPPSGLGPFDIAGSVLPAATTCGDYFDYLPMPGGRVGLTVGDVCGHGLSSAFIMTETRAYLRPLAMAEADPGCVLSRLNPLIYGAPQNEHTYVTLCLVRLDPATGRLVYASAGHPPGVVLAADGSVKRRLDATGFPLGLFPEARYETGDSVVLEAGELLLLLTDGITEAESPTGAEFGMDAALEVVRGCRGASAAGIVRDLQDAVTRFVGEGVERKDDLTVVVCKAL